MPRKEEASKLNDEEELEEAKNLFRFISDGKSEIDVHFFNIVLERMGIYLPFPLTRIVFNAIDVDGSGQIEFTEFADFVGETDKKLIIDDIYFAEFTTRPFHFTIVSTNNGLPCIISELLHRSSRDLILPRSKLLEINKIDVTGFNADKVYLELNKTSLPVTLKLEKKVTKANLALMVERGPWAMVHKDIEIERRKNIVELNKASYVDGWHCPEEDGWAKVIFKTFDDEDYSCLSKFVVTFVLVLIFVSTINYVLESIPSLTGRPIFTYIEIFVSICFTIEYAARILTCRNAWIFFWDYMNLIDFLAVIPFWIEYILGTNQGAMLRVIRVIRLARVVKILKNARLKENMDVLSGALKKSIPSFGLLGTIIILNMTVFASLMYAAEGGVEQPDGSFIRPEDGLPTPFISIFAATWWCIVTMTCVGYGDMYPISPEGQLIGVVTMFCGLLVIALPVIIVGGEFEEMYQDFRRKKRQRKREKELKAIRLQEEKDTGFANKVANRRRKGREEVVEEEGEEEEEVVFCCRKKRKKKKREEEEKEEEEVVEEEGEETEEVVEEDRKEPSYKRIKYTEDYFAFLNNYINRTCEGFSASDTGVVQFFTPQDITSFVEQGYETQDEIIEVLQQGPSACYFLPDSVQKWKLFALYEIFAKKHQAVLHKADDPFRKLRLAFFRKTDMVDDWEQMMVQPTRPVVV